MHNPRPVPLRRACVVKKGSKILGNTSGGIPGPSSCTARASKGPSFENVSAFTNRSSSPFLNNDNSMGCLSTWPLISTRCWAGVHCSAFKVRLSRIWIKSVPKFAPADRVADYMAVHTFFTGARGVIAPLVAFFMANHFRMSSLALLSAALIVDASLLLLPEIPFGRRAKPAAALVEEISE